MFEIKDTLYKTIKQLTNIMLALTTPKVNTALDVMAKRLVSRHKQAFDQGGHQQVGGSQWAETDPWWASKMSGKSGTQPLVWTGEAKHSLQQMGMAANGVANIGAVEYIGKFQFGPLSDKVPFKGGMVSRGESDSYVSINRKRREVFHVAESDWNPFMQHLASAAHMNFENVGGGFQQF